MKTHFVNGLSSRCPKNRGRYKVDLRLGNPLCQLELTLIAKMAENSTRELASLIAQYRIA